MLEIRGIRIYAIKYVYPDQLDNVNIDTALNNNCELLMMALVSAGKRYPHS